MKRYLLLLFLLAPFVFAWGQNCSSDSLVIRSIKATHTDGNIDWELQNHQVYLNPDCPSNGKLLLHMVGSFDNPASTNFFCALAADNGYKVISLKYPNGVSAAGACRNSPDGTCFWKFRQEIIFGTDTSSNVVVDSANSIVNRLEKLLVYLNNLHSFEGWDLFLNPDQTVNWSDIVVSGHSQGGGHAAFIAKQFEVSRVLMFAAPNDFSDFYTSPALWTGTASATPDSCHYAFGNLHDDVVDFSKQYQVWQEMNLLNPVDSVDVDPASSPYAWSRVLYTTDTSSSGFSGPHNSVVMDNFTPLVSGTPIFEPVWRYMLGVDGAMTGSSVPEIPAITIYPNPSHGQIQLKSTVVISKIEVYDLSAKLLLMKRPNSSQFSLDLGPHRGLMIMRISVNGYADEVRRISVQ